MDDREMLIRFREGEVGSFDMIFARYHKKVFHFALCYLKSKDEAEEVVQEVFMNLWKNREQINEYYTFSRYLFKITYNAVCKKFRKQASDKRHASELLKGFIMEDMATSIEVEYDNLMECTQRYIEKLPKQQKKVLLMSLHEHLSSEEIARKLRISNKTVKNHLSMAKAFLKKSLINGGILSAHFFWLFIK